VALLIGIRNPILFDVTIRRRLLFNNEDPKGIALTNSKREIKHRVVKRTVNGSGDALLTIDISRRRYGDDNSYLVGFR